MAELLVYEIQTKQSKNAAIRKTFGTTMKATLKQYSLACMFVAKYADEHHHYNRRTLAEVLSDDIQREFLLPSGIAECVCRRVGYDFARLNPLVRKGSHRTTVPDYYGNKWMLYSKDTASVVMQAANPADEERKYLLSLGAMKTFSQKKGDYIPQRLKVPFEMNPVPLTDDGSWHNREMRLLLDADGKSWSLLVAVGVTNRDLDEDEDDPTQNPDHQEPDDMPPDEFGE